MPRLLTITLRLLISGISIVYVCALVGHGFTPVNSAVIA